ncbi:MAG TPA: hypothetical protein VLR71_10080 [Casimicrobiaceae bacterium]|nr:hypothetical protein [Casimicrobiaceae bacterium]
MSATTIRLSWPVGAALLLGACSTLQSWVDASNAANTIAAGSGISYATTVNSCKGYHDNPRVTYSNVFGKPTMLFYPLPLGGADSTVTDFGINPTSLDESKHPYNCVEDGAFQDGWYLQDIQGIAVKTPSMCPLGGSCDAFITRVCKAPGLPAPCTNATTPMTGPMGCAVCGPVQFYPH